MMNRLRHFFIFGCLICFDYSCLCDSPFVVPKKKLQSSSKLKSQYAEELGECISAIPELHKTLATIQEKLISELTCLLDNDVQVTKTELDVRIKNVCDLKQQLKEVGASIIKRSDCVKIPLNGDCSTKK